MNRHALYFMRCMTLYLYSLQIIPDLIIMKITLLILITVYYLLTAACTTAPFVVQSSLDQQAPRTTAIYVVNHGWHTGLVVPGSKLEQVIPELTSRFHQPAFYEIGWGDKGFYQAQEITTGITLQALFWAEGAIVHVVAVPTSPEISFPYSQLWRGCLSESAFDALSRYLVNSLQHNASGQIIPIAPGIYGDSQFYDGTGRYHLFNTCNKWTAKGLRSAGLDIDPMFKLISNSVMDYLRNSSSNKC